MSQARVSLGEMETTINLYPKQVQDYAEVYTCIPATMKKLKKLAANDPACVIEKEDDIGLFAQVPSSWICIRKPRKVTMSDERKAELAARLQEARQKKEGGERDHGGEL